MNFISAFIFACFLILVMSCNSPQFHQNKVIAHRGAWKAQGHPQNSMASLEEAIRLGCEGSEFDVWMTSDDVLVVNHDADFEGMDIETTTYKQLLAKKHKNGEEIPTAEAYLKKGMEQNGTKLIFEIKPSGLGEKRNIKIAEKSVELVKKIKADAWVDYISFSATICEKVIELDPKARVAYLNGDKTPAELKAAGYFGFDYHIELLKEKPHWIEEARELGLTVNSWTVNNPEDMEWLLEKGADFITTDEPKILLEMIQEKSASAQ